MENCAEPRMFNSFYPNSEGHHGEEDNQRIIPARAMEGAQGDDVGDMRILSHYGQAEYNVLENSNPASAGFVQEHQAILDKVADIEADLRTFIGNTSGEERCWRVLYGFRQLREKLDGNAYNEFIKRSAFTREYNSISLTRVVHDQYGRTSDYQIQAPPISTISNSFGTVGRINGGLVQAAGLVNIGNNGTMEARAMHGAIPPPRRYNNNENNPRGVDVTNHFDHVEEIAGGFLQGGGEFNIGNNGRVTYE